MNAAAISRQRSINTGKNKVQGHHGQSQKANIPRSKAASTASISDCAVEHVVPQMEIVNRLMDLPVITEAAVMETLSRYLRVVLVTNEEHTKLNASGLRSSMPHDWDEEDVFARYKAVGIEISEEASASKSPAN
jgi:hypothetical protein